MASIFGWITPSRVFVPTSAWGHYDAIMGNDALKRLIPDELQDTSHLEHIKEGCEELIAQGEHPEWHCYEMACDSHRDQVVEALYASGAVRVGSQGNTLYYEGSPQGISNLHQFCKDFAEDHNMGAAFEPRNAQRRRRY